MNGYQITFFTEQDRRHKGQQLAEWLIQLAKDLDLRGATLVSATEGFGKSRRLHSAHFFELADQPVEVLMAVSGEEAERLFARLNTEQATIFYVKIPVEFGVLGGNTA